jgi:site-specific recombinase XerD
VVTRGHPPASARSCTTRPTKPAYGAGFAPHQLRHAHAVEMSRGGVPLLVIQRQLGHADLAITSVYLRGIDNTEIVHAIHERPAPMIPATHGL